MKVNKRIFVGRFGKGTSATLIGIAAAICGKTSHAFPSYINDTVYSRSQPWLQFSTSTAANITIQLNLSADCVDPVGSRALPASTYCAGQAARPDVYVHVFRDNGGEVALPVRCTAVSGASTVTCALPRSLPAAGWHGLLIHGGDMAVGNITGTITVTQSSPAATLVSSTPIALGGNLSLPIGDAPGTYDAVTVLMPDGPGTNGPTDTGNQSNDYLGTDATELWILDSAGLMVRADLAHSGVGAAALLSNLPANYGATLLARPWAPPPTSFRVAVGGATLAVSQARALWSNGSGSPIVGNGRMRLILNERSAEADADRDGLSNNVEAALELCTGASPYTSVNANATACALATGLAPTRRPMLVMDPRDTDGDGISDSAEVLGSDIGEGAATTPSGGYAGGAPVVVNDADQTFPLWGFNPRHKDMLVEVDRTSVRDWTTAGAPIITNCTSPTLGSRSDRAVWPPVLNTDSGYNSQLAAIKGALLSVRNHFDTLRSDRVSNPDGVGGIRMHFDIRLPAEASVSHGVVPSFVLQSGTTPVVGLVAYIPGTDAAGAWRIGSMSGCGTGSVTASSRHGGYSHYMQVNDIQLSGNGSSLCDVAVGVVGVSSNVWAHEIGHHLGLMHDGPISACAGSRNPFSPVTPEVTNGKPSHVSLMDYKYQDYQRFPSLSAYENMPSFSSGSRIAFPVPRRLGGVGAPLVTPERLMFGPRSPSTLTDPTEYISVAPRGCINGTVNCEDGDADRDGTIATGGITASIAGADGTGYRKGLGVIDVLGGVWCENEKAVRAVGGACCATGTLQSNGSCSTGGAPQEIAIHNTPLLSSQHVDVIANNRYYSMYWDHSYRDQYNDCRCNPATDSTCSNAYCHYRTLRWSAWDTLEAPAGSTADPHCFGEDCRHVASGAAAGGWLQFDGSRLYLPGTVVAGAATIESATPANETVVLGFSSRSAPCGHRSSTGAGNPDQCGLSWSAGRVYFANASTLQTTGFVSPPGGATLQFPAGQATQVDSITVAAWDAATAGSDAKALVVVRQRTAAALPSDGFPLWFTTCSRLTGCAVLQPLTVAGTQLRSRTMVSLAVSRALGSDPRLAWLLFDDRRTGTLEVDRGLRLARFSPVALNSLVGVQGYPGSIRPGRVAADWIPANGALNIEFTSQNQLVMVFEQNVGNETSGPEYRMSSGVLSSMTAEVATMSHDGNQWGRSRETIGQFVDSGGNRQPIVEQAPGSIPFLRLDSRTSATTSDTAIAANRVRMSMAATEVDGIKMQFFSLAENSNLRPLNDMEEQTTLGYYLCRTLESSAGARRSPDLAASEFGRIACPGAGAFNGGGDVINVAEPVLQLHCRPAPLCNLPDPRFRSIVSNWVGDRAMAVSDSSGVSVASMPTQVYTPTGRGCDADAVRAYVFPQNWNPNQ